MAFSSSLSTRGIVSIIVVLLALNGGVACSEERPFLLREGALRFHANAGGDNSTSSGRLERRIASFVVLPEYSGLLLPSKLVPTEMCDSPGSEVWLEVHGTKRFFSSGCVDEEPGILGFGEESMMWTYFASYEKRGEETTWVYPLSSSSSSLTNVSQIRSPASTSTEHYTRRGEMPRFVVAMGVIYLYVYLRTKVMRKLLYVHEEGLFWFVFNNLVLPIFCVATLPFVMEMYLARTLLSEDAGLAKSTLAAFVEYYAAFGMLCGGVGVFASSFFGHPGRDSRWTARMALVLSWSTTHVALVGSWYTMRWKLPAYEGSFVDVSLFVMLLYEQSINLVLTLSRVANRASNDPLWWSGLTWLLLVLPLYSSCVWMAFEFGAYPFFEKTLGTTRVFYTNCMSLSLLLLVVQLAATKFRRSIESFINDDGSVNLPGCNSKETPE